MGPFSGLIRRIALGMLVRELDPATRNGGEIVIGPARGGRVGPPAPRLRVMAARPAAHAVAVVKTGQPITVRQAAESAVSRGPIT